MPSPNIIWIFPDEWRHNAIGYAGNAVVRTPHADALAARGATFARAYCESPICQPSRASLLTASYPRDHGMTHNYQPPEGNPDPHLRRLIPPTSFPTSRVDTFLHRLTAAGYRTVEVGKMHFHNGGDPLSDPGFLQAFGFDEVSEEYDKHVLMLEDTTTEYTQYLDELGLLDAWREHEQEQVAIMFGVDPKGRWALAEQLEPEQTLDAHLGRRVCDRISRLAGQDQPFFIWAGFMGPHPPLDGPSAYSDVYDPATIPMGPLGFDGYSDNLYGEYSSYMGNYFNVGKCGEGDFRQMAKYYYGKITLIDEEIGRIVETVERAGIADNTWIVFSSDHGELLGDHQMTTKCVFYDASVRVPAFVSPPRGVRLDAVAPDAFVQGIDVVATILALAGADAAGLHGQSLVGAANEAPRQAVFSQISRFTMVATPEHKLVVDTETVEPQILHDLRSDPDERRVALNDLGVDVVVAKLLDNYVHPFLAGEIS